MLDEPTFLPLAINNDAQRCSLLDELPKSLSAIAIVPSSLSLLKGLVRVLAVDECHRPEKSVSCHWLAAHLVLAEVSPQCFLLGIELLIC
jgi:hypothetical protein